MTILEIIDYLYDLKDECLEIVEEDKELVKEGYGDLPDEVIEDYITEAKIFEAKADTYEKVIGLLERCSERGRVTVW